MKKKLVISQRPYGQELQGADDGFLTTVRSPHCLDVLDVSKKTQAIESKGK